MRLFTTLLTFLFLILNPMMIITTLRELESSIKYLLKEHYGHISVEVEVNNVIFNIVTSIYGLFSCRPCFIKPLLYDCTFSTVVLILSVIHSLAMCWKFTHIKDDEFAISQSQNHAYIGIGLLLLYFVWICISIVAYFDVQRLHVNFLEWIYKERSTAFNPQDLIFLENRGRVLNSIEI
uniref:Uncharacterized protein n=1 Tax=Rhabditophanes sp. KR3021 TaxID=114890 RepID=A0AC35TKH4_9BILA